MDKRRETRRKVSVAARALFIVETIEQVAYYDGPFFHLSSWPYLSVALSQTPFSVPTPFGRTPLRFGFIRPFRSAIGCSFTRGRLVKVA